MEKDNDNFLPASLRIGTIGAPTSQPKQPFSVLLRRIDEQYAEYLKNQSEWNHNDTRDLIITLKIALERMHQERDSARRDFCDLQADIQSPDGLVKGSDFAKSYGWECFDKKEKING